MKAKKNRKISLECKKIMKDFYCNNKLNFTIAVFSQILTAILYVAIAFLILITIEAMEKNDIRGVIREGEVLLGILLLYLISSLTNKTYKNRFMMYGLTRFKSSIFEKILNKTIGEYEFAASGGVMSAFYNDLGSIEVNYLNGNLQLIHQVSLLILALISMLYLNVFLACCVLATCIIPLVVSYFLGKRLVEREEKTSDESEGFASQVKDILNGFIVIKSFKAEKEVLDLFNTQSFTLEEAKQERRNTNDTIVIAGQISGVIMISLIFVIGQFLAYKGIMSIGAVLAFVQLSNYVNEPVQKIVPLWSNRKAAISLLEKISVISQKNEQIEKQEQSKIVVKQFQTSIQLKDLSFGYEKGQNILNHLNLTFEKGKSYAIVGASGCGKSTLLHLMLGYYNNYDGSILYDGISIKDINYESLYDLVAVMQQNVFLFNSSIEDNITMFKKFDKEKIQKATELAGIDVLIQEKGYDYDCGIGGDNLSGGEKQRVSIARCLLRGTPILIMDEATAALDNAKAYEVENLMLQMKDLTRIVVTHKLEAELLKKYDSIVVLKNGKVSEQGTFDELIQKREYFYSLYSVSHGDE